MKAHNPDLRLALISFLMLFVAGSLVGCAEAPQSPAATAGGSALTRPFIGDYYLDTVTHQRLELIGVSISSGLPSSMTFTYPTAPSGDVRCTINATFRGDVKNGTIEPAVPDGFSVTPAASDSTPCQWMRSASSYSIVGQTLTVTYGNGQSRQFTWNGVQ